MSAGPVVRACLEGAAAGALFSLATGGGETGVGLLAEALFGCGVSVTILALKKYAQPYGNAAAAVNALYDAGRALSAIL